MTIVCCVSLRFCFVNVAFKFYFISESIAKGFSVRSPSTSYIKPTYIKPSYIEPTYIEPSYIEPSHIQPSYIKPRYIEPSYIEPSCTEPSGTEPSGAEPSGTEPSGTEPGGTEPSGTEHRAKWHRVARSQVAQSQVAQSQMAQSPVVEVQKLRIFFTIFAVRARPSAEIRGGPRGRGSKTGDFLRFLRSARDPLRRSALSLSKDWGLFTISAVRARPSAEIVRVEALSLWRRANLS